MSQAERREDVAELRRAEAELMPDPQADLPDADAIEIQDERECREEAEDDEARGASRKTWVSGCRRCGVRRVCHAFGDPWRWLSSPWSHPESMQARGNLISVCRHSFRGESGWSQ